MWSSADDVTSPMTSMAERRRGWVTLITPRIAALTTGNVVGVDRHVLDVSPTVTTSKARCLVIGNSVMTANVTGDMLHDVLLIRIKG